MVQNIPGNELQLVYYDNHKQKKAVAAVECHQSLETLDW